MSLLENYLEAILDKFTTFKSEISFNLQQKCSEETVEYVNKKLDLFYYEIKYDIYKLKTQFDLLAYNNEERNEQLETLQKAECVIQLQTLSAAISKKINDLHPKKENPDC